MTWVLLLAAVLAALVTAVMVLGIVAPADGHTGASRPRPDRRSRGPPGHRCGSPGRRSQHPIPVRPIRSSKQSRRANK
jgi:hypothetical protein